MFTHRFASTHDFSMPNRLVMVLALAITLALGALPPAQAGQHSSAVPVHSQLRSNAGEAKSIIFVGGKRMGCPGGCTKAGKPRRDQSAALPRMGCPGGCSKAATIHSSDTQRRAHRLASPQAPMNSGGGYP